MRSLVIGLSLFVATLITSVDAMGDGSHSQSTRDMSYEEMAETMQMDDTASFGRALLDQAEWRDTGGSGTFEWQGNAWYGGDINKLLFKTQGEREQGEWEDVRAELFWDRVVSRWWRLQIGARQSFGAGPDRTWAAVGVEGNGPMEVEIEATLYAGEQGRTAARIKIERDLFITQRLILQPELETNWYGTPDRARQLGAGFSDLELALRLRYEIRREVGPYLGIAWQRYFGETADFVRAEDKDSDDLQFLAGLRIWF